VVISTLDPALAWTVFFIVKSISDIYTKLLEVRPTNMAEKIFKERTYAEVAGNRDVYEEEDPHLQEAIKRSLDTFESQAMPGESVIQPDVIQRKGKGKSQKKRGYRIEDWH
jgi:hypothetical protein